VELVNNIKDRQVPNGAILVSFEVVGLYPSVPHSPTLAFIRKLLEESATPEEIINEFMGLLQLCISPNFCKFNNEYFKFLEGFRIPTGSPLGSTFSEIFLKNLENALFSSGEEFLTHITYWYHYVDDVLCLWQGPQDGLHLLLSFINSLYPSVKFTIEIGGSNINFFGFIHMPQW